MTSVHKDGDVSSDLLLCPATKDDCATPLAGACSHLRNTLGDLWDLVREEIIEIHDTEEGVVSTELTQKMLSMQHNNNSSLCPTGGTFPFQPLSCREMEVEVLVRSALRTDAATLLWKQSFQNMNITFEMEHKVTRSASTHLGGDGNSASPMCEKSNCLVSCTDLPHLSGKVRHVSIDAADTHWSSRPTLATSSNRKRAKEDAWSRRYNQILQYRAEFGHCIVPRRYAEVGLYGWIKKQRYNHKQWELGKPSQLTHERIKALDDIGFSWSARSTQWESRFEEFQRYVALRGHARIGTKSSRLFDWAKTQRREHREWLTNGESTMTQDRYERLTSLGFRWSQR